ncbi:MAG: hypothetical protein Kow0098_08980 [Ignavibacteriaceae bacterium]
MKRLIFISLLFIAAAISVAQTTTIHGTVKDKDYQLHNIDSAYVKGIDLGTLETLFETFTNEDGFYQATINGTGTGEIQENPLEFRLSQNYPNPFNPETRFEFTTPEPGNYTLRIFNILGEEVFSNTYDLPRGEHAFNISGLGAAGVYIYNITGKEASESKKMIQLDGTRFNPSVTLLNQASNLNKPGSLELRITADKEGYYKDSSDISIEPGGTYVQYFQLVQVPRQDTITFFSDMNLVPTNTPGDNTSITATNDLFSGTTNQDGEFSTQFTAQYIQNPDNPSDREYTPSEFTATATRPNTLNDSEEFTITNTDTIHWLNNLQQTLIDKNGSVTGNVDDEQNQNLPGVLVKHYDHTNEALFGQAETNTSGDYAINFTYQGYENDPTNEFSPVQQSRTEFSKNGYIDTLLIKSFEANDTINMTLKEPQPYIVDFTAELRKTFKGEIITDLDTIWINWMNGEEPQAFLPVNGTLNVYKELETVSPDTTAEIFHTRPDKYLNWIIGHRVNPERGDWLFQNPSYQENSVIPLKEANNEGTIEMYLIPKWANYGINNDIPMDMESTTVQGFFSRNAAYVSGFRPSPAGWDTTYVLQFTFNLDTGNPIDTTNLNRANVQIQKFLDALQWQHKNLLVYRFTKIDSLTDPFLQYIINEPRNLDNFTYSSFYNAPAGNYVEIAMDGTYRIKFSNSTYGTATPDGGMQEEIFTSMINGVIDGPSYIMSSLPGWPYTDLGQNLIGIAYIMHAGTQYLGQSPPEKRMKALNNHSSIRDNTSASFNPGDYFSK